MLDELHIRELGVIEDATLQLSPGLTVITGETGAGKTMLVSALELLLGARADSDLVRAGAEAAHVEARIHPVPPSAAEWVRPDEDELIVARELPADGRSRARIQGKLAPISGLADVLGSTVEVHAQHEHVRLARASVQRELLDRFAGDPHARTLDSYRATYEQWREARTAIENHEEHARERARTIDRLRFEVGEIDVVGLDPEADADLDGQLEVLEHAEEMELALREAASALGEDGAGGPLGVAVSALRRVAVSEASFDALRRRVEGAVAELTELARDLRGAGDVVEHDPERLSELRERRATIRQLERKYGGEVEDILAYADEARAELERLEAEEADADELEERLARLTAELGERAAAVNAGRRVAGDQLATVVEGHLTELGMPHARFEVALTHGEPRSHGADHVEFLLAPNPGEPARPLQSAASGGERSRVALAIEVALADVDDASVLVFDEVDAGIGGETAMAVGRKLAQLATRAGAAGRQVLCVTHLAQLAAFADVHHVVEKGIRGGRTVTAVRELDHEARVDELARMMGGSANEAGREHARELLGEASHLRAG